MSGGTMAMAMAGHLRTGVLWDYFDLTKPRVVLLHLITATAAMFLAAEGLPHGSTVLFTLAGGGLMAGAANTLNCYLDRDLDGMMARTRHRPLPAGRLRPYRALSFGIITGLTGLLILSRFVSLIAAVLALEALACYVLAYTRLLKRRTYWSTVIGSGAGAIPPLVGWVAVTDRVELTPLLLFVIIALWTPPHFWTLAIFRRNDYEHAGLSVLPGGDAARWIMVYSLLLVLATLLLAPVANLGLIYFCAALFLGLIFLNLAVRLGWGETSRAAGLYFYSIAYIVILFAAMIADRLATLPLYG